MEVVFFITIILETLSFIDLLFLDFEIFIIWIEKDILYKILPSLWTGVF